MKILEHGFYAQTIKCNCGCVYQYEKNDIDFINTYWSNNKDIKQYFVRCPECKQTTYIPDKIVITLYEENQK